MQQLKIVRNKINLIVKKRLVIFVFAFVAFLNAESLHAQSQQVKDTLYFWFDRDYTIDGDRDRRISFGEFQRQGLQRKERTKTSGYVMFVKYKVVHNLKPKIMVPLKDYLEKRDFYYAGEYNTMVDQRKLDALLDKHNVFLVKKDKDATEFLEIRSLQYNTYYPVGKGANRVDKRVFDTLVFDYNKAYLKVSELEPWKHYVLFLSTSGSNFVFEEQERLSGLGKKSKDFKEFLRKEKFYYKSGRVDEDGLHRHLGAYVLFLKEGDTYIKVNTQSVQY